MLSDILHQPIRTQIMALLLQVKELDFSSLKQTLSLTDGHMTTHMRALIANGYIIAEKRFVDKKPKTFYQVTPLGKMAFLDYLSQLREMIEKVESEDSK